MKKRILSLILALALCLSLLPAAVFAADAETPAEAGEETLVPAQTEETEPEQEAEPTEPEQESEQSLVSAYAASATGTGTHSHKLCSHGDSSCSICPAEALTDTTFATALHMGSDGVYDANGVKLTNGNNGYVTLNDGTYYLEQSIGVGQLQINGNVFLCLNGNDITASSYYPAININENATLTLCNCQSSGKVTHDTESNGDKYTGRGVYVSSGATFNMYNGTISGNKISEDRANGGGVYVEADNADKVGEFHMYGGTISDNEVAGQYSAGGGGVCVDWYARFYLHDGTITRNKVIKSDNSTYGGGVYVQNNAIFTMENGEISDNELTGASTATHTINGGSGVFADSRSVLNLSGGKITGNKIIITEGQEKASGAGLQTFNSTVNLSGSIEITGNAANENVNNNVYFNEGTLNIVGELTGTIGVTTEKLPDASTTRRKIAAAVRINGEDTVALTADDIKHFIPDAGDAYLVVYEDSALYLKLETHEHPICGASCTHNGEHESITDWKPISDLSAITGKGNYYLTDDVKLSAKWTYGNDVTLCLNGHSITANGDFDAIAIGNKKTLTLCDCKSTGKITHGEAADGTKYTGCGVITVGSTFNMYGGSITGNRSTFGAGVRLDPGSTFNMYGGAITSNEAYYDNKSSTGEGGGVWAGYGSFNMYGGSITGNTARYYGGGVYVDSNTTAFTVSGKVDITGNTTGTAGNNVQLRTRNGGKTPTITIGEGGLDEKAQIGVTTGTLATGKSVTVATGAENGCTKDNFSADAGGDHLFKVEGDNVNLYNGLPHKHPICGATCAHGEQHTDELSWTPLTYDTTLRCGGKQVSKSSITGAYLLPAGNYYLEENITLDATIGIHYDVNLCLNGKTLSTTKAAGTTSTDYTTFIKVYYDASLTLCDCGIGGTIKTENKLSNGVETRMPDSDNGGKTAGSFTMYGGTITNVGYGVQIDTSKQGAKSTVKLYGGTIKGTRRGVFIAAGNIFEMYGGEITGSSADGNGGGVYVASGSTFTMTGGSITGNSATYGSGVYVASKGTFNMSGGSITGNSATYGGGVAVSSGTFNMYGGTISGNTATADGGGVYLNSGTFTMSSGSIARNTAEDCGGGVYVASSGTFAMSGGSITGNNATGDASMDEGGGGVYVYGGSFTMTAGSITGNNTTGFGGGVTLCGGSTTISGKVEITSNRQNGTLDSEHGVFVNGKANNLYLFDRRTFTIGKDDLTDACIGISTEEWPEEGKPIKIATGATKDQEYYSKIFTPDMSDAGYEIIKQGESNLYLSAHVHDWKYELSADMATILATCKDTTCGSNGFVTISEPEHKVYGDGKDANATLTDDKLRYEITRPTISYQVDGSSATSNTAPTDAGTYTASITLGGVTASVTYTIEKATPTADDFTFSIGNLTYDGTPKAPTITSEDGMGEITIKYYQDGKEVEPKNAGKYTVKIDVAEGSNYEAVTDLTVGEWTFTIQTNNTAPDVALSGDMVYKKGQIRPDVTVKIGNTTLTEGKDYAVSYGENLNAGQNAGTVTITAMGNYGFAAVEQKFDISAQTIQVTAADKSSRVGKDLVELTYTCTEGLPYAGDNFTGKLATDANKNVAGTYTIKLDEHDPLTLGSNYNIIFTSGTYTVLAKETQTGFKFENAEVTKTYGDPDFTITASGQVEGSTVLYFSSDPTVAAVDAQTGMVHILKASTEAITITATASATDDYATGKATYTLTVNPKTLTTAGLEFIEDNSTFTKVYDGDTSTTAKVQIKASAKVNEGDTLPAVSGSYAYDSANVKDASKVTFTSERTENSNYILPAGLTVEHEAKIIPADQAPLTITSTTATYGTDLTLTVSGGSGSGAVTYTVTDGSGKATITGSTLHPVQAGTVKVVATKASDGNYNSRSSDETEITIHQAAYTGTAAKTVDIVKSRKTAQTDSLTAADFFAAGQVPDGAVISSVTPGSGTMMASVTVNAGTLTYTSGTNLTAPASEAYAVTITTTNYENITAALTFQLIDKQTQTLFFAESNKTATYKDQPFTPQTVSGAQTAVSYSSSDETVATVDNTGEVTVLKVGTTTITAAAEETDVYAADSASYTLTVNKLSIAAPAIVENTFVYNGKTQTYRLAENPYYTITDNTAKDVGMYIATVALKDTDNTEWSTGTIGEVYYSFWITQAPATVTVLDQQITVGQSAPELTSEAYTITGLFGEDTISVTLYYADPSDTSKPVTPDTSRTGTYAIVAVLGDPANANYTVTFENGTLTIVNHPILPILPVIMPATGGSTFTDVAANAYYYDAVEWAVKNGITDGLSAKRFGPDEPCTRAQIVTFLWRAAGSPEPVTKSSFTDVVTGSYYEKAVAWAIENGITVGTSATTFSPDMICTRAHAVTFLARAVRAIASGSAGFRDVADSAYYAKAVKWATDNAITNGIAPGLFGPDYDCTRAQIVTFLWRLYANR